MDSTQEFAVKRRRIADLMAERGLGGLLLSRSSSWSWATCGREANVATNSESAIASLLFTPERDYVLASRIEMPRLLAEELGDLPLEPIEFPWYEPERLTALATGHVQGVLGSDGDLPGVQPLRDPIAALRFDLTAEEQARFRLLGKLTGAAVEAAARAIAPGMSELEIAGILAAETFRRNATPVVELIAVDDRVRRFRHPSPTAKPLERYAMLVLCVRQHGLVASATRLVHFGPLPDDLRARAIACAYVDAVSHTATQPGVTIGAVFDQIQQAYALQGVPEEWRDHHQGGMAGYENREVVATPGVEVVVHAGQAYAWNPSIAGVKSEDTILVGERGFEVITATGDWPSYEVTVAGRTVARPAILERAV